jgi:hypothetical protein
LRICREGGLVTIALPWRITMTLRTAFVAQVVLLLLARCASAQELQPPAPAPETTPEGPLGWLCPAVLGLLWLSVVGGAAFLVLWLLRRSRTQPLAVSAPASATGRPRRQFSHVSSIVALRITGTEGLTCNQLVDEIRRGGKFVVYRYCISVLVLSFLRTSGVYFIRAGENPGRYAGRFDLISFFLGWWGFPFGPILTIRALTTNGGGIDVTDTILEAGRQ